MAETRKLGRPSFSPTRKEAFRKDSNMYKKMFRDKKRKERDEALSTVVPPTAHRYKHIRISTATFWRWRSLAQELGLDGDEQMASFLLNTYYERAVEAASKEQRQDIPQNSEESRQKVETSMFQGDEQGTETDAMGSTCTTMPIQATQDGSIGLHLTEHPPDSMKEQSEGGGEMLLEGEFTCLVKTEPHDSGEESNEHGTLPSVSQQGDGLTGDDDDDRKEIEEVEFECLIKEEPDDGEHNQPSCSKQGWDSRKQSSYQRKAQETSGTSHDRSHEEHPPKDFPIQAFLGNHSDLSTGGNYSCEYDSFHQGQSFADIATTLDHDGERLDRDITMGCGVKGDKTSGEASCDRSHAKGQIVADSATISDDREKEMIGMNSHSTKEHDEKSEAAFSKTLDARASPSGSIGNDAEGNHFICAICSRGFKGRQALDRHMRSHSEKMPHKCTVCKKRFLQRSDLKKHFRTHPQGKPYSCSLCEKQYCERNDLIAHMRVHSRKNHHPCSFCSGTFVNRSYLDAHIKTHVSVKPHKCTDCNLRFCSNSVFEEHKRTHTGERPFKCSLCNKAFAQSSTLSAHIRIHTGEKPYECSVCGDRFSFNTQLMVHKKKHTGVKPHLCSICDKRFWRKGCLNRHMKIHT